ncbi:AAA family ATPase [Zhaonella formicivorans]|uniref:AAA family ATPase n=1 Tax=Zhaonella formicivorans TaxID=2528593 RepID=UPI0010E52219|nr:hypothetical protein [Zhaonella formicivorans]
MNIALATGDHDLNRAIKERVKNYGSIIEFSCKEEIGVSADIECFILSSSLAGEISCEKLLESIISKNKRVILIAAVEEKDLVEFALTLGIYDIVFQPARVELIIKLLFEPAGLDYVSEFVLNKKMPEINHYVMPKYVIKEQSARAKISAWWSAQGRAGKTSLAVMQAVWLARTYPEKVALLDFKEVTPHVHKFLKLETTAGIECLYEAFEQNSLTAVKVLEHMQKKYGVYFLTGVGLKSFYKFTEKYFGKVLELLKTEFDYIVVDLNDGLFFSSTAAALQLAEEINVVLLPHMYLLEDTRDMVNFLKDKWDIEDRCIRFVLNKTGSGSLEAETVERVFRKSVMCVIEHKEIAKIAYGGQPYISGIASVFGSQKSKGEETLFKRSWLGRVVNAGKSV